MVLFQPLTHRSVKSILPPLAVSTRFLEPTQTVPLTTVALRSLNLTENTFFTWTVAGQTFTGTGTLEGTTLTVDWGETEPVIYEVKNGGKLLEGTWAGGNATETLRK